MPEQGADDTEWKGDQYEERLDHGFEWDCEQGVKNEQESQRTDDGAASRLFGFGDIAHPLEGYTFHLIAEFLNPRLDFHRDSDDIHGFVDRLGSNTDDFCSVVAFYKGWSLRESDVGYGRQRHVGPPRSSDFNTLERVQGFAFIFRQTHHDTNVVDALQYPLCLFPVKCLANLPG